MSKLSKEELLVKLDYAFGAMSAYEGFDEAHQQIKELIESASKEKEARDWDNARDAYSGYREDE